MKRTWTTKLKAATGGFLAMGALFVILGMAMTLSSPAGAAMSDYTWYPIFIGQQVPPNILFIVDFGDATLQAAFNGPNHQYPISFCNGCTSAFPAGNSVTSTLYASNVTIAGTLVAVDNKGNPIATASSTNPADTFDPTNQYYGLFDPFRCYTTSSNSFVYAATKINLTDTCTVVNGWDGNFLNWVAERKMDIMYQAIVGGAPKPAQANADGTANSLAAVSPTGQNGSNNTCASDSKSCWRFVKFVPATGTNGYTGRVPTTLPVDAAGAAQATPGRFFGSGEGLLYVNDNATPNPFNAVPADQYNLQVNLLTEPNVPSGTGSYSGTCDELDPNFAGHLICYQRARSLGLFQTMRTDAMRVAIMFVDAGGGNAGNMQFLFDASFNSSSVTGIRNHAVQTHSPLSEALYEALCYYRKSQGTCYNNSPTSYTTAVQTQGDAFWFANYPTPQTVSCCKNFVLMISPGVVDASDGNVPQNNTPFPNGAAPSVCMLGLSGCTDTLTPGVTTGNGHWLDNVAYYGQTHNVRDQACPSAACVTGTHTVAFYAVNAMGGPAGSTLLASAARFGGFTDQNNDNMPNVPTSMTDLANNPQSCTPDANFASIGLDPTLFSSSVSNAEWDVDQNCIPDTYFDASKGGNLTDQINKAIAAILKRAASGTSVSVLATSSTGEGAIYQAYFFPSQFEGLNEIKWAGFTQGLFVDSFGNIREDFSQPGCTGPPDGKLVLEDDCIIKTRFDPLTNDVKVDVFKDDGTAPGSVAGDGVADTTTPFITVSLKNIQPIWEAGARLAYQNPGTGSCSTPNAGLTDPTNGCRRLFTWADTNFDKKVGSSEVIELIDANKATLCPYLAARRVTDCNNPSSTPDSFGNTPKQLAQLEAANIINFHRGQDGTTLCVENANCLRNRTITTPNPDNPTSSAQQVWKLGDIVDATPIVVGSPKERFDVIYGDSTYTTFVQQYLNRRQVAYVGANDGMLHAFNAGFFVQGDDGSRTPKIVHGKFTTAPPSGITTTRSSGECAPGSSSGCLPRGAELWAFVPQELLPHLQWFAESDYTHVAYMDLKPKVTDARIFCDSGNPNATCWTGQSGTPSAGTVVHPAGWGTILIAGMRYGGSCGVCTTTTVDSAGSLTNGGGTPMTVTADFTGSGTMRTRVFYSAYYVFDITDPEQDPVLLWTLTDSSLGLTTSFPAVVRVSPLSGSNSGKTDNTSAKWLAVFGTGPTSYIGASTQSAQFIVVQLSTGPDYTITPLTSGSLAGVSCTSSIPCDKAVLSTAYTGNSPAFPLRDASGNPVLNSFMGDVIGLDSNLDFRVDVIYAGSTITNSSSPPTYIGKMFRLATSAVSGTHPETLSNWGITSGSNQVPTVLLSTFACSPTPCTGATKIGPITAGSTVAADDTNNIWVYFGTGRFFAQTDKGNTDAQYFFGVKDPVANTTSCLETSTNSCQRNDLVDVSNVTVCVVGVGSCNTSNQVTGLTGVSTFSGTSSTSISGLVMSKQGWSVTYPTAGERNLSSPTILGGTVFFTTFIPINDICTASGNGNLYALFYLTGSAYKQSTIGTTSGGADVAKSISLGTGLPSQMAVQIGAQGTGSSGSSSSAGCAGRVTGYIQASTGVLGSLCGTPALSVWSRMVSWRDM
jgi:type IV pilus assembly protein PilY1